MCIRDSAKIAKLKALFKKLLMFALVMGVVCLVLFFWCTARYTSTAHTDRFTKLTAINGASMYYDWNRDRNARNGFQSLKTASVAGELLGGTVNAWWRRPIDKVS